MIYQFKDGPLDGQEVDIPEMPISATYRHPIQRAIEPMEDDAPFKFEKNPEARYRVTDIGEITLDHYEG